MNNKSVFLLMGWITLLVFPAIALGVLYIFSGSWQHIFTQGIALYYQIPIGIVLGYAIAYGLKAYLNLPIFNDLNHMYSGIFNDFDLSHQDCVFISVCAGVGEEILFRGCIQEYAGILPTAIIFVAIHGYLNPFNAKVMWYGLVLTALFIGVGYLMVYVGLYACIIIHIIIDIILFESLISGIEHKN